MTGKTHLAVGSGTALFLLSTGDINAILGGTTLALIGSLVPDIDTEKSKGAMLLKNLIAIIGIVFIFELFLKSKYHIDIFTYIMKNRGLTEMLPILAILLVALIVGKCTSHRGFTHSLIGICIYSFLIFLLTGPLYKWFLIGYAVHIFADMLNRKEVRIFYPLKKGICFNICSSTGITDKILFIVFSLIAILKISSSLIGRII